MNKLLLLSIILIFLFSCQKEKHQIIADDFKIYVQRFFEEANKRNLFIKLEDNDLQIRFSKLVGKNGVCFPQKKLIEIDSVAWKKSNEFDKEQLIYHELGHCVLGREHLFRSLPRGECESIMSSLEGSSCIMNFNSESWRKYYFDELFSQKLILPHWYMDTLLNISDTILLAKDKKIRFSEDSFTLNINKLDTVQNFVIDFSFIKLAKINRDICLQFDNKIISFVATPDFNLSNVKNTQGYYYAGRSNLNVGNTINIQIIKRKKYYHFLINNMIVHIMDFETIKSSTIKISCFSTESDFEYKVYTFK